MTAAKIVPPTAIESSLKDLWNAKENKNKMSASLYNLIFFTQNSPREEYVRKIASNILEKFPARVFLISSNPSGKDELKTAVSVVSTEQGAFEITCDLIEIASSGKEESKIPLLLLPHLIPDLPVFLVWAEDPALSSNLYEGLKDYATRVIFDSESTEDLALFAKTVLAKEKSGFFEIGDLNWARLESWRSLISSTFTDPVRAKKLQDLDSFKIVYNGHETPFFCHTKIQSLYLQAWISTRLKLPKDHKVKILLEEVKNEQMPPGMIVSLEMKTTNDDSFVFSRDDKHPSQICFEFSTKECCSLPFYTEVSKGESGKSLVKEVCHKGTSPHYIEALEYIVNGGPLC